MRKPSGSDAKVVPLRLTVAKALEKVREIAADSNNVIWTTHMRERMEERGIDATDVLNILRKGSVEQPPTDGNQPGELKIKVTRRLTSGREAGVVIVLVSNRTKIKLATTEWEDLK
jgi:multidrug efflux pump subunit AcrB